MRVTADTNLILSAALWGGNPRRLLDASRDGIFDICTSPALLYELENVLRREKFEARLSAIGSSADDFVEEYKAFAILIDTKPIEPVIIRDPDDDNVIACAVFSGSDIIASGDKDLLELKEYNGIRILTATDILTELKL